MGELTHWHVRINLLITLDTALHIGTGLGLAQILDDRIVQGPHPQVPGADLPYIPGSSLKGRLRFHTRQMSVALGWASLEQRSAVEAHLFGFPDTPGGLVFPDAHLADLPLARSLVGDQQRGSLVALLGRSERSFVSLSRQRRVALDQRLFRIELADGELSFATMVHGALPRETARRDLALLVAAARDMTHLGGHKARGLGRCRVAVASLDLNGDQPAWRELLKELR